MLPCAQCGFRSVRASLAIRPSSALTTSYLPSKRLFSASISRQADTPVSPSNTLSKPKPSSVPAGTPLKGINYIKKLTDPIALPDEEYPPWLWTVLEDRRPQLTSKPQISAEDAADLYSKSKGRRRMAQKRIDAKEASGIVFDVPADHKTEDMPFDSYEESQAAIKEGRKAARARRRATIKEKNFLGQLG